MDHRLQYKYQTNKLKEQVLKSEMDRHELEQQFEHLMRERNKCEKSAIKSLKHRYERFLEEDKQRSSRNDNLLRMLERIDYQAATLAAKTEKLKLLKDQHELYLMRNWNPHRSVFLPPQSQTLSQLQPTASQLNVPISTSSSSFPPPSPFAVSTSPYPLYSSTIQQQHQPNEYHQQHPPPFAPLHQLKGETNLKSDFVKYLSEINQFRDIYDKNGTADSTRCTSSTYQSANLKGSVHKEINFPIEKRSDDVLLYPRNNNQSNATLQTTSYLPSSDIPNQHHDFDKYKKYLRFQQQSQPPHQIERHHQLPNIEISTPMNFHNQLNDDIDKSYELTNNEFMLKNNLHQPMLQRNPTANHNASDGVSPPNAMAITETNMPHSSYYTNAVNMSKTVNDNLLENNSSGVLQTTDINNTAVSISSTSANVAAINTNGVIKAIHQPEDENYAPSKIQINDYGGANNNIWSGAAAATAAHPPTVAPLARPPPQIPLSDGIDYVNETISPSIYDKHEIDYQKNNPSSSDAEHKLLKSAAPITANTPDRSDVADRIAATTDDGTEQRQNIQTTSSGEVHVTDKQGTMANIEQIEEIYGEKIDYPPNEIPNNNALLHADATQRSSYLETEGNKQSEELELVGMGSVDGGGNDNDAKNKNSQGDTTQYDFDQTQQQYQNYSENGDIQDYYTGVDAGQHLEETQYDTGNADGSSDLVAQAAYATDENVYPEQSYYDGSKNQTQDYGDTTTASDQLHYEQTGNLEDQMTEEQYAAQQLQYTSADYQQQQSNEYAEQPVEQVYSENDYQNQYQAPETYPDQYNAEQYETYPAEQTEQPQQDFNNSYYSQEPGENYYTDENQHQQQTISTALDENATNNIEHTYIEPDVVNENAQQATAAVGEYYAPATDDDAYAATANAFGGVGGGDVVGDEDESSTTYSENINLPQQQMFGGSAGLLGDSIPAGGPGENISGAATPNVAPNYLESETDDSTAQQVKGIANDESDFDFSAN